MWSMWTWVATAVAGLARMSFANSRRLATPMPASIPRSRSRPRTCQIAAKERHDMRLEDESDVVIDPTKLKPSFGDLEHSSLCVSGAGGSKQPIDRRSLE